MLAALGTAALNRLRLRGLQSIRTGLQTVIHDSAAMHDSALMHESAALLAMARRRPEPKPC